MGHHFGFLDEVINTQRFESLKERIVSNATKQCPKSQP